MRQAALLGNAGTKRTDYFRQAAAQAKLPVLFVDWKDFGQWKGRLPQAQWLLKIDPPLWDSFSLGELDRLARGYKAKLRELSCAAQAHQLEFFNHPLTIEELLDKRACKKKLVQAGLPVTEMLNEEAPKDSRQLQPGIANVPATMQEYEAADACKDGLEAGIANAPATMQEYEAADTYKDGLEAGIANAAAKMQGYEAADACKGGLEAGISNAAAKMLGSGKVKEGGRVQWLLDLMREKGIYQVFIKPNNGSGAAGVSALRWQPTAGRIVLYTCALGHPRLGLVNTKCLRRFSGQEALSLLGKLLELDCVVERWYAKAECQGHPYDLRTVVLGGKTQFLLGRLSKGPITNLHLNNHPLEADGLGLPKQVLEEVDALCKRAVGCFDGLRCAGIDILLEKGSLCPRIIEMNAQGDLIYQDIFHENQIYRRQVEMMGEWLGIV